MQPARAWYCRDDVVDEYKSTLKEDDEKLPMLKTLKIIRAIVVNVGLFAGWIYALYLGGDPTIITVFALGVVGAYNGLELGDYLALVQAYSEIQAEANDGDD
ncbi:hypothetical protein C461_03063 [Halorubrum aidingense JCM 13560]|uniref:2TM domain-containing protein n=1 Tax=Halorubrum aidingense JCM 13560 TaxID=1230454 RepID=M0PGU3_9EURY|nr:hypothetical protein C461_03063 [Halorubrum aidingense JCM 13560]